MCGEFGSSRLLHNESPAKEESGHQQMVTLAFAPHTCCCQLWPHDELRIQPTPATHLVLRSTGVKSVSSLPS